MTSYSYKLGWILFVAVAKTLCRCQAVRFAISDKPLSWMNAGASYVEGSILPRLYRETPVNSTWKGSGNVQ